MNKQDELKFKKLWQYFVENISRRKTDLDAWASYFDSFNRHNVPYTLVRAGIILCIDRWRMSRFPLVADIMDFVKIAFKQRERAIGVDCCDGFGRKKYCGSIFTSGCIHSCNNFEKLPVLTEEKKKELSSRFSSQGRFKRMNAVEYLAGKLVLKPHDRIVKRKLEIAKKLLTLSTVDGETCMKGSKKWK